MSSETGSGSVSPRQASELLEELGVLRNVGRRAPGAPWLPLLLAGTVTTLSAPLEAAFGLSVLGPTWIVGGVLCFALIARYHRRRASFTGVSGRGRELAAGSLATFLTCYAIAAIGGSAGDHAGPLLGPPLVVLAAYGWYGWYQRSALAPVAVAPGVLATVALYAVGAPIWMTLLAFGLGLIAAGAAIVLLRGGEA